MSGKAISVVAAPIRDHSNRVLLVRKRGTTAFMQPGGKRDGGESDVAALSREILEELGCCVDQRTARSLGVCECAAANEPGLQAPATVYAVDVEGAIEPKAEVDQIVWVEPRELLDLRFAPLTRDHMLRLTRDGLLL
jgi:8-oxo-dGTP diphosphatase